MYIVLKGNPISTQHAYGQRGKIRYMKKVAKDLKRSYQFQAVEQWKEKPLEVKLEVAILLFFKDKRKRDWDNWHKLSMDALTGIVWEDDSQIQKAIVYKGIDKENPRIEIRVNEYHFLNLILWK